MNAFNVKINLGAVADGSDGGPDNIGEILEDLQPLSDDVEGCGAVAVGPYPDDGHVEIVLTVEADDALHAMMEASAILSGVLDFKDIVAPAAGSIDVAVAA